MEDTDKINDFIVTNLNKILNELCPFKVIQQKKNYKPWVSQETLNMMMERDRTREQARLTGNTATWQSYRQQRNKVNKTVDKERRDHYKKIYEQHQTNKDISATYKTAKAQAGWKHTETPVIFQMDGRRVTAPQELANIQMETFEKKTKSLIDQLPQLTDDPLSILQEELNNWGQKKDLREVFKLKNTIKNGNP